jgi:hypothetical protein
MKPPFAADAVDAANSEIVALQADRVRADEVVHTLGEACAAIHEKRVDLTNQVPDGEPVLLIAANTYIRRMVAFSVVRRGPRFFCNNFDIFEITDHGVASLLDLYAAA